MRLPKSWGGLYLSVCPHVCSLQLLYRCGPNWEGLDPADPVFLFSSQNTLSSTSYVLSECQVALMLTVLIPSSALLFYFLPNHLSVVRMLYVVVKSGGNLRFIRNSRPTPFTCEVETKCAFGTKMV